MSATDAATVAAVLCHEYHPMHWDVAYGNRSKPCEACKIHAARLLAAPPIAQALAAVEAVARVEALADEWATEGPELVKHAYGARDVHEGSTLERCATDLRAALRPGAE